MLMMMINGFFGPYRFLSNFYPSPIDVCHQWYETVEHAYQAMKTKDKDEQMRIASLETPGLAKKAGQKLVIREDWERLKVPVMLMLLRRKFEIPELRDRLLLTGDAHLEETNRWGDTFWGVSNGKGENHLGKLLMQVRHELNEDLPTT